MSAPAWTPAYVGLGSNLRDPLAQVVRGFAALERVPQTRLVAQSRCYGSKPLGHVAQPDFVNAVAGLLTQLAPGALLTELKRLEAELGRAVPVVHWGPRLIDFDLLVYGTRVVSEPELTLPHPGLSERVWALVPLLDVAPELEVPGFGPARVMAARLDSSDLRVLSRAA